MKNSRSITHKTLNHIFLEHTNKLKYLCKHTLSVHETYNLAENSIFHRYIRSAKKDAEDGDEDAVGFTTLADDTYAGGRLSRSDKVKKEKFPHSINYWIPRVRQILFFQRS